MLTSFWKCTVKQTIYYHLVPRRSLRSKSLSRNLKRSLRRTLKRSLSPRKTLSLRSLKDNSTIEESQRLQDSQQLWHCKKLFLAFWRWYMIAWAIGINFHMGILVSEGLIFMLQPLKNWSSIIFLVNVNAVMNSWISYNSD